mgnify:CR=1 FL=1
MSKIPTTVITGLSLGGVKPPVAHDLPPAAVNPPQPAPAPRPAPAPPPKKAEPGPATETTILPLEGTTRLPQMPPPGREPAGRPRLQSRPAATSPSGPPPVPPAPPRPSPAGGIVALLLALAGEALTQAPAWTAWFRGGAFPRQQAVTLALALLVLGILILSRQRTLTIIAGVILAFMILMCAAQIALPRLGMTAGLLSDDVVSRLASTGQCILAAGLFAASLVLLTGQRLAHWTLAALAVVVTAVGSFVDLGPPLPVARAPAQAESRREATPPVVAEKVRLPLSVPAGWVAVTDKGRLAEAQADDLYQCGTEDLQIAVRHFAARPPGMTLDNYAGQLYQQRSAESAALKTFVSKTKVSGKPNQRRLAVLADKRTDVLVVEQNGQLFTVTVVGGKESFRAHEGEIKQILGAVE